MPPASEPLRSRLALRGAIARQTDRHFCDDPRAARNLPGPRLHRSLVAGALLWGRHLPMMPTLPHKLRAKLAFDPALTTVVLREFIAAVSSWLRRRARRLGLRGVLETGAVTVIGDVAELLQRFVDTAGWSVEDSADDLVRVRLGGSMNVLAVEFLDPSLAPEVRDACRPRRSVGREGSPRAEGRAREAHAWRLPGHGGHVAVTVGLSATTAANNLPMART
jgi:hypothetical protein